MAFDPDAYLAQPEPKADAAFDPDAYLGTGGTAPTAESFDPDAYLGTSDQPQDNPDLREELAGYDAAAAQRAWRPPEGVAGKAARLAQGTQDVLSDMAGGALRLGALALPDADQALTRAAEKVEQVRNYVEEPMRARQNPQQDQDLTSMLASGVGQFVPQLVAAPVRGLALVGNAGQFYAQEYNAAKEKGASEGQAVASGLLNMPAAALDYVMERAIVGRFLPKDAPKTVGSLLKAFGFGATGEIVTETAQNKWADFIAGTLVPTDPNRNLARQYAPENIDQTLTMDAKTAAVAGILGGGASGIGEVVRPDTGAPDASAAAARQAGAEPFDPDAYLAAETPSPGAVAEQQSFESAAAQSGAVDPLLTEETANDAGPIAQTPTPGVEQSGLPAGEGLDPAATPATDEPAGVPATPPLRKAEATRPGLTLSAPKPGPRRAAPSIPYAPLGTPDLVDYVVEAGGIQPSTRGGEMDDRTENLKGVYAGLARGTQPPDVLAQSAYEAGLISDPTAPALWTALGRTVEARQRARAAEQAQDSAEARQQRESRTLARALAPGRGLRVVPVDTLNVGDVLTARGRTVTVRAVDPDTGDVEVDAGADLDFQRIPAGTVLHAEQVSRTAQEPALAEMPFSAMTSADLVKRINRMTGRYEVADLRQAVLRQAPDAEKPMLLRAIEMRLAEINRGNKLTELNRMKFWLERTEKQDFQALPQTELQSILYAKPAPEEAVADILVNPEGRSAEEVQKLMDQYAQFAERAADLEAALILAADSRSEQGKVPNTLDQELRRDRIERSRGLRGLNADLREQEKQGTDRAIRQLAGLWMKVAKDDAALSMGRSTSTNIQQIVKDMAPGLEIYARTNPVDKVITLERRKGGVTTSEMKITPYESGKRASIYAEESTKGGGGAELYQIAFTWMHNNGIQNAPHHGATSWVNRLRRTSNMISSALRLGTTRHLKPADQQKVVWQEGDDLRNIGSLLLREKALVFMKFPQFKAFRADLETGAIFDEQGQPISQEQLQQRIANSDPKFSKGVGVKTAYRAILTHEVFEGLMAGNVPALTVQGRVLYSTPDGRPGTDQPTMDRAAKAVIAQAKKDGVGVRLYRSASDIEDRALRARVWDGGYNGFVARNADGKAQVALILDRISDSAEALRVYREEVAHMALRTGLATDYNRVLETFADAYLTSTELAPLVESYPQLPGEGDGAYRLRLADEYIAKQGRENPQSDLWQRFVAAIRELLAKAGLTQITAEEAARAILKRAQSVARGRASQAVGDVEFRFSSPEYTPTFDPARPLIAAGANLPTEVRPVLGGMEHVKPLEMPELVALTQTLTGELPKLQKLRKANGLFKPLGHGLVKLDPRIFTNPVEAAKTLAHEIGHLVDYLGSVPPSLKRGNLLGRMATLDNFLKTTLPTLPAELTMGSARAMTPADRSRLRTEAARMAGPRPGPENRGKQMGWASEVRMHYNQLVAKESKARGLTTLQAIRAELLDLSREWRGDWADAPDSYRRYRESGKELYADAMSVLFNNPFLLADRAPTFYTMFWGYLDAKPEVKTALLDVQTLLHKPKLELLGTREERTRAAYLKGDEIFRQKWEEQKARGLSWRGLLAGLKEQLYNAYDPIIRRQRQVEKLGPLTQKQRIDWLLDAHPLGDNRVYLLLQRIQARVVDELEAAGIGRDTLGLYLQMKRIQNEQYEIAPDGVTPEQEKDRLISGRRVLANPEGHTPETARAALLKMRLDLGLERMTALERAADRFHDIVFEQMGEAVEAGLINRTTFEQIIKPNRKNYATFVPLKYWDTFVSSRIAQQVGSLESIGNPFTATVMKLVALNRAAHENRARSETVRFMREFFGQEIAPAETIYDGRGQRPQEPKEPGKALLTTRENGATVGYIVPEDVGLMFEHLSAEHKMTVIRALSAVFRNVVYPLIIRFNPVFQLATSPIRDFQRLMVNVPDGSRGKVAREYFKELWRAMANPSASAQRVRLDGIQRPGPGASAAEVEAWRLAQEMMHTLAIWTPFESYGRGLQETDTFAQILQKYHLVPEEKKSGWLDNAMLRPLTGLLHKIEYAGQVLEGMPKTVAYKVATKDLGWDRERAGVYVRNHIGVPNFTKRGKQAYIANAVAPFWTVFLNGWESDFRQSTGQVQGKSRMGWWLSWMVFGGGLLKLAQVLAEEGLLGDELKEMMDGISENDKSLLGVVPLGWAEGGEFGKKVVYVRIPQDETSRTMAALMRHGIKAMSQMARGEPLTETSKAFATAYGATPSLNPVLQVAGGWGTFLAGHNPVDSFRGSAVLSTSEYLAGGLPAYGAMGYWTMEKTGLTNLVRYDRNADTTLEHFMGGVPIVNALMRISDAGYRQRQQAAERQEDAASARVRLSFSKDAQKLATELNYLRSLGRASRTPEQDVRYHQLSQWGRMYFDPAREQILDNPEDKDLAKMLRESVNRSANDYLR